MKVTMFLCDFAQASDGKLNILGGGWSVKGENSPMAVALKIEVPWSEANRRHQWRLRLVDSDGQIVTVETPVGPQPIELAQTFEVGRPPGLPEGSPLDVVAAVNVGPIPLPEGQRFEWRLAVNDETEGDWHVSFLTRPPLPPPPSMPAPLPSTGD